MLTQKQLEANRKNAQQSTGPRTVEGKGRSRGNAIKHGLRAVAFDVLPNEDPDAYRDLVQTWLDDHLPRNAAEDHLVRHAASLTWQIDRATRHAVAVLSGRVAEAVERAERGLRERLDAASRALLPAASQVARFGLAPADASRIRDEVESTAEGCRWLIRAWQGLRASAEAKQPWTAEQELHAIRLLGQGPRPIADAATVDVVVANRVVLHPQFPANFENWYDGPLRTPFDKGEVRAACERRPADPDAAFAVLQATADRAIASLEETQAAYDRDGDPWALEVMAAGDRVSFDPSPEGERLRRHRLSLQRDLLRTVDALLKLRLQEAKLEDQRAKAHARRANEPKSEDVPRERVGSAPLPDSPEVVRPESRTQECANEAISADSPLESQAQKCANEPISAEVSQESRTRKCANEPISRGGVQVRSMNDPEHAVLRQPALRPFDADLANELPISCERA